MRESLIDINVKDTTLPVVKTFTQIIETLAEGSGAYTIDVESLHAGIIEISFSNAGVCATAHINSSGVITKAWVRDVNDSIDFEVFPTDPRLFVLFMRMHMSGKPVYVCRVRNY